MPQGRTVFVEAKGTLTHPAGLVVGIGVADAIYLSTCSIAAER